MSGKKILVVEDDPSIRRVIVLALKSGGYADVQEVESGDVAVEVAFEKRPDLVLLDLMLPKMDGFEVCKTRLPPVAVESGDVRRRHRHADGQGLGA